MRTATPINVRRHRFREEVSVSGGVAFNVSESSRIGNAYQCSKADHSLPAVSNNAATVPLLMG